MADQIPMKDRIKLEDGGNTLIQSYINRFNKEIEGNDVPIQAIHGNDSNLQSIAEKSRIASGKNEISDLENNEEIITEDDNPPGTYFVDEQGHYYFQTESNQQAISSVGDVLNPDDEILLTEESTNDILIDPSDGYQTLTIVPSESANGEVSYLLIVQQPEDKVPNQNDIGEIDNNLTVYDFDENEDLEDCNLNVDSVDEDEKIKILPKKSMPAQKPHMCSYCSYTTSKKYLLSRHMKSHSEERPHKCSVCSRGFKTLASLQNHINTHTGTKPHKCRFCNSAFTTSGELVRHVRYRHTHEKPHKCTECEYASVELSKLKRHARCHTGERPYQCPHCTYASPDTFKLKRHLRIHTGEKPYECEHCHMCFTQSNSLKAHKLRHNIGDKPVFRCELCPTTCGRKTDLRIHVQKLHTSEEPIKCKRCGKSFPDRYTFKLHYKTHDGEKFYKCELCAYASASLRHLSSHVLVHTDEKPYACEKCDQAFRQKQLLKRHQNLYHNPNYVPPLPKEKSQECRECGKQFHHKGNLIRHMAVHDPESKVFEKSLALKMGRQRKIELVDSHTMFLQQDKEFDNDNEDEEEEEEEEEDEPENVTDNEMEISPNNMPHYVVFEVIQATEDGSNEEISVSATKPFIPTETEEDDGQKSTSKADGLSTKNSLNTEKDVENCFGFDVEDAEDDLNDDKINLYGMKFLRD